MLLCNGIKFHLVCVLHFIIFYISLRLISQACLEQVPVSKTPLTHPSAPTEETSTLSLERNHTKHHAVVWKYRQTMLFTSCEHMIGDMGSQDMGSYQTRQAESEIQSGYQVSHIVRY